MRGKGYLAQWFVWFVALMSLWLLLTGTFDLQEVGIGVAASGIAAVVAVIAAAKQIIRIHLRPAWLRALPSLLTRVVVDNWVVLALLVRVLAGRGEVRGEFRALRFDPGGDDALSATRRALITAAVSLSPNSYVVGIDREAGIILCHQLIPSSKESARRDLLEWK
jgi:multisubunit Na+/H+ antiporter MnhE subunit